MNYWTTPQLYWKGRAEVSMPFIPYFSNCKGFGQYIYFTKLSESSDYCDLVSPSDTEPVFDNLK